MGVWGPSPLERSALTVDCTTCGAVPGEWCRSLSGSYPQAVLHVARLEAAP
jgi:hypothetical protein